MKNNSDKLKEALKLNNFLLMILIGSAAFNTGYFSAIPIRLAFFNAVYILGALCILILLTSQKIKKS